MWRAIYHELRRWAKASDQAIAAYKRTEIIVETDRVWVIRKSHSKRVWCADCGREVDMVGLNESGAKSAVSQVVIEDRGHVSESYEQAKYKPKSKGEGQ